MYIPFGQIGLGELTEKEKESFLAYLSNELSEDEGITSRRSDDIKRKGLGWETASHAADAIVLVGFIYHVGKNTPKTVRNFLEYAKKWAEKNNKHIDAEQAEKVLDFMEKDKDE